MKRLFFLLIFATLTVTATPPRSILLTYSRPADAESRFVRDMAELQGIQSLEVALTGPVVGRDYYLTLVHSRRGVEVREELPMRLENNDEALRLRLTVRGITPDSVRLLLDGPQRFMQPLHLTDAGQCILMETYTDGVISTRDTIPVMAFCPGVRRRIETAEGASEGINYCAVRDARLHPSKWYEFFGLEEYIYLELRFADKPRTR